MSISETLREQIALSLFDIGSIQLGKYKFQGGRTARLYLDLRLIVSFPETLRLVSKGYQAMLEGISFDILAAQPVAGLPICTALSLEMNVPMIYPRKTARSYGTGKSVEGIWEVGQTAVIVDDVIQTGESILQGTVSLKTAGIQVRDAVVLIDRENPTAKSLFAQEYRLHSLFTVSSLLSILEENGRITQKQLNKVLKSFQAESSS
ncbi:MAG: orotate phosphoribosyltransferase [Chloroflexota bacterium]